jgi:hypothetical protein
VATFKVQTYLVIARTKDKLRVGVQVQDSLDDLTLFLEHGTETKI